MKTIILLASLLAVITSAVAQDDAPIVASLSESVQKKTMALNPQYLVFAPKQKAEAGLPVVIYLHGAGGVGDEVRKVAGQARQLWEGIEKFGKGPCILVAPQCLKRGREGGGWQPDDLNLFLEHVKATLPVDAKRVYLTGNSMGGMGSWMWGGSHPEHFAAIAPVSGGIGPGGPKDVTENLDKWAANLAKVPVYAFAGAEDRVVPAERSQQMIDAIRKAGGKDAQIKVYPDQGHNARQVVYSSEAFYDWLFSKKRE